MVSALMQRFSNGLRIFASAFFLSLPAFSVSALAQSADDSMNRILEGRRGPMGNLIGSSPGPNYRAHAPYRQPDTTDCGKLGIEVELVRIRDRVSDHGRISEAEYDIDAAKIISARPECPGVVAGLRIGDYIIDINQKRISANPDDANYLPRLLSEYGDDGKGFFVGSFAKIQYSRVTSRKVHTILPVVIKADVVVEGLDLVIEDDFWGSRDALTRAHDLTPQIAHRDNFVVRYSNQEPTCSGSGRGTFYVSIVHDVSRNHVVTPAELRVSQDYVSRISKDACKLTDRGSPMAPTKVIAHHFFRSIYLDENGNISDDVVSVRDPVRSFDKPFATSISSGASWDFTYWTGNSIKVGGSSCILLDCEMAFSQGEKKYKDYLYEVGSVSGIDSYWERGYFRKK